ncbi:MAG: OmpH family outer membrane protein [Bacteroidetes bacterium]|nr:OmpH family outer membrane protein [Bacteroidota bacterium]MDA0922657.1 OmpH family outer membrane protein [Bacteroidota bacterium]MDA1288893.1 OmpH family outer membrane protein [Bacteroidota bacterium]
MKHLSTLIVSLLFFISPLTLAAQSKVAHINTQQLISEMPEVISAQNELKKLEDQYAKEMETSVKEFQTKAQTYQGDAQNQTDLINQQRQVELQEMQQRIQDFRETAAQELQKRSAEMMRPLYDKARAAIEKVAQVQGFDYVLDSSPGGSVIMASGKDLIADVKTELGF